MIVTLEVEEARQRCRPKKTWEEVVDEDMNGHVCMLVHTVYKGMRHVNAMSFSPWGSEIPQPIHMIFGMPGAQVQVHSPTPHAKRWPPQRVGWGDR